VSGLKKSRRVGDNLEGDFGAPGDPPGVIQGFRRALLEDSGGMVCHNLPLPKPSAIMALTKARFWDMVYSALSPRACFQTQVQLFTVPPIKFLEFTPKKISNPSRQNLLSIAGHTRLD